MNMEAVPVVEEEDNGEDLPAVKQNNTLPIWGNKETMNINQLILKNIRSSPYFKQDLYRLKTYHEVVDEIYYKVTHLEPWEKNSRKLASQIGHAGEVRGVSAGGIVSSPFCLLYKLFTLKLTRKQLQGLLDHSDSPYIRGLGFMYIRYCQPPSDLLTWFEPYFDDDEMIDLKAGSGFQTTIGEMCKMMLLKLDWFGTLFPRIPVNVEVQLKSLVQPATALREAGKESRSFGEAERRVKEEREQDKDYLTRLSSEVGDSGRNERQSGSQDRRGARARSHSRERRRHFSRSPDRRRSSSPRQQNRYRGRSRSPQRKERSPVRRRRSLERRNRSPERGHRRSRSREQDGRKRDRSRSREREDRKRDRSRSREREDRKRDRSRSREREDRKRDRSRSREREDRKRDRSRSREREDRKRVRSHSREREDRKRDRSRSRDREDRKRDRSHSREREDRKRDRSRSRGQENRKRNKSRSRDREDRKRGNSRSKEREDRKRDRSRSREQAERSSREQEDPREKSRSKEYSRRRERSP